MLRLHRIAAASASAVEVAGNEPTGPGALPWELGAIEGLAQGAAVLLAQAPPGPPPARADAAPRGMLVAIKHFTIEAFPPPGAEITYRVQLVRRLGATVMVAGTAECCGRRLAGGQLTLWTAPA